MSTGPVPFHEVCSPPSQAGANSRSDSLATVRPFPDVTHLRRGSWHFRAPEPASPRSGSLPGRPRGPSSTVPGRRRFARRSIARRDGRPPGARGPPCGSPACRLGQVDRRPGARARPGHPGGWPPTCSTERCSAGHRTAAASVPGAGCPCPTGGGGVRHPPRGRRRRRSRPRAVPPRQGLGTEPSSSSPAGRSRAGPIGGHDVGESSPATRPTTAARAEAARRAVARAPRRRPGPPDRGAHRPARWARPAVAPRAVVSRRRGVTSSTTTSAIWSTTSSTMAPSTATSSSVRTDGASGRPPRVAATIGSPGIGTPAVR